MCLAVVTNPFFAFLKVLSSTADGDATQKESFSVQTEAQSTALTGSNTRRYLKGAKVGRKKVHLTGSDVCWSRAAHDGL